MVYYFLIFDKYLWRYKVSKLKEIIKKRQKTEY